MASSRLFTSWLLIASFLLAWTAHAVHAEPPGALAGGDCAFLIQALIKARLQPRVAQFLVDASGKRLQLLPVAFRVGDNVHETEAGAWVTRKLAPAQNELVDALRGQLQRQIAWCRVEADALFRSAPVMRVHFRHPDLAERHQPACVLIDPRSGLPVWHGYASMEEGYDWDYGANDAAGPDTQPRQVLK